ncbi:hypothetical protein SK128_007980, partial [Halocaridina rubra]
SLPVKLSNRRSSSSRSSLHDFQELNWNGGGLKRMTSVVDWRLASRRGRSDDVIRRNRLREAGSANGITEMWTGRRGDRSRLDCCYLGGLDSLTALQ